VWLVATSKDGRAALRAVKAVDLHCLKPAGTQLVRPRAARMAWSTSAGQAPVAGDRYLVHARHLTAAPRGTGRRRLDAAVSTASRSRPARWPYGLSASSTWLSSSCCTRITDVTAAIWSALPRPAGAPLAGRLGDRIEGLLTGHAANRMRVLCPRRASQRWVWLRLLGQQARRAAPSLDGSRRGSRHWNYSTEHHRLAG